MVRQIVHKCCCCCSVKKGTATIGILNLIYIVLILVVLCMSRSDHFHSRNETVKITNETIIALRITHGFELIAIIILLIGIWLRSHTWMLLPYLCMTIITIIIVAISIVIALIKIFPENNGKGVTVLCSLIIYIAICLYFWIVILSYYAELKNENNPERLEQSIDV